MAVKTQAQLLAQVASLLADNTTGNISALDVRTCLNDIIDSASYGGKKVYKALLTQTGTSAPVATVLENTLSGTPVWSRSSAGVYLLTLASEFTTNTVLPNDYTPSVDGGVSGTFSFEKTSTSILTIRTKDPVGNESDDLLSGFNGRSFLFELEVYP